MPELVIVNPPVRCGACGGPMILLGKLGNRRHYRCRDCGVMFSRESKGRTWTRNPELMLRQRGSEVPLGEFEDRARAAGYRRHPRSSKRALAFARRRVRGRRTAYHAGRRVFLSCSCKGKRRHSSLIIKRGGRSYTHAQWMKHKLKGRHRNIRSAFKLATAQWRRAQKYRGGKRVK